MSQKKDLFVSVESALNIVLSAVSPIDIEYIPLIESCGRVLSENIISEINVPPCDNSAMDGYALRAEKTSGATMKKPIQFIVKGEVQAGGAFYTDRVTGSEAIRIMTGAPIPPGVDAVIPVENTEENPVNGGILVYSELHPHDNIRFAGEDIKIGQIVLQKGSRLSSADVGILSALNISNVPVYKKPRVAIISTGDEIAEVGENIREGQVRNSNSYTLHSEAVKYNGNSYYMGIARDSITLTREKLSQALEHDIVITTGGVSQGKYDFVQDVLLELGVEILFDSVKMKPGKPMIFGKKNHTLVFGLPGNPVSTMVSFIEFVRPALLKMGGAKKMNKPELNAILDSEIRKKSGRKEYLRGYFTLKDGVAHVVSTGSQGSGILRSMSIANCLIVMPEASIGCRAGDLVKIQLILHEEID